MSLKCIVLTCYFPVLHLSELVGAIFSVCLVSLDIRLVALAGLLCCCICRWGASVFLAYQKEGCSLIRMYYVSNFQSYCPFSKMPLLISEGHFDLGHFAPPNLVSQNAPPLLHMLSWTMKTPPSWVILPLMAESFYCMILRWRGKMTQPIWGHFGKGAIWLEILVTRQERLINIYLLQSEEKQNLTRNWIRISVTVHRTKKIRLKMGCFC